MTTAPFQQWDSQIILNGVSVPCYAWQLELGTYGQIGRIQAWTSLSLLRENGINVNIPQIVTQQVYTPMSVNWNGQVVFVGNYMLGDYEFDEDNIELTARDAAGVLLDMKRSLADLHYENLRLSQLVQNIVDRTNQQFPNTFAGTDIALDDDPAVGEIINGLPLMKTYPQQLWNLLVFLARMTAANVWVTPDSVLHFRTTPEDQTTVNYCWFLSPRTVTTASPVLKCRVLHQPNRNSHFSVVVISHHQQSTYTSEGWVTVVADPLNLPNGQTVPAKQFIASAGKNIKNVLSSQGLGIPVYTFRHDGLSPDQAVSYAIGYANEIAKRLFIYTLVVEGNPQIQPLQTLQLDEGFPGALYGFSGRPMVITGVTHTFHTPQDDSVGESGFLTTIKAMTLPPARERSGNLTTAIVASADIPTLPFGGFVPNFDLPPPADRRGTPGVFGGFGINVIAAGLGGIGGGGGADFGVA